MRLSEVRSYPSVVSDVPIKQCFIFRNLSPARLV